MWRDFPLVVAFVGVCASIASFIALMEISAPGWGVVALEHWSAILIALSIALALAVERRATTGAWPAQIVAEAVSVAFAIVALVKVYSHSSTVAGGIGESLNWVWYLVVVTAASLAGSAAARMHRR
jgi:uncharacterized membrane protein YozB (DUF420 family)